MARRTAQLTALLLPAWLISIGPSVAAAPKEAAHSIVNGERELGFEAVAAYGWEDRDTVDCWCTATLITPRLALTAAHCLNGLTDADVDFMAAFFGPDTSEPQTGQVAPFRSIHPHPDYQEGGNENPDFALIELRRDVPGVRPMHFRRKELTIEELCLFDGDCPNRVGPLPLKAVGFGSTTAAEDQDCVKRSAWMNADDLDEWYLWNEGTDTNTCFGDSGGPVFAEVDGDWVQWGVVSWGDDLCAEYGANVRTDRFTDWIEDHIERVHGTRDACEASGFYEDGSCDTLCPFPDPDCSDSGRTCRRGCSAPGAPTDPLPFAFLLPGLVVLLLRRGYNSP